MPRLHSIADVINHF